MLEVFRTLVLFLICEVALAKPEVAMPKGGEPGWLPPKQETFSDKEVKDECRKYNGKVIGYYGKVFRVEACKRYLMTTDEIERLLKKKGVIREVELETIAKIPSGVGQEETKGASCKKLNNKYVLSTGGDMYFIKDCKKFLFPDWETYVDHAKGKKKKEVFELDDKEFETLQSGRTFPSVLDEEYNKENVSSLEADLIPIEEACAGIDGKYVSYYSKVYKVEKCRKREINDPASFTKDKSIKKIFELSSEQWLSLPTGEPL